MVIPWLSFLCIPLYSLLSVCLDFAPQISAHATDSMVCPPAPQPCNLTQPCKPTTMQPHSLATHNNATLKLCNHTTLQPTAYSTALQPYCPAATKPCSCIARTQEQRELSSPWPGRKTSANALDWIWCPGLDQSLLSFGHMPSLWLRQ